MEISWNFVTPEKWEPWLNSDKDYWKKIAFVFAQCKWTLTHVVLMFYRAGLLHAESLSEQRTLREQRHGTDAQLHLYNRVRGTELHKWVVPTN